MGVLSQAVYDVLAGDGTLTAMLSTFKGLPAVFTTEPVPGDATLPYVVSAGAVAQVPNDTKTTRGRVVTRDVRCYTAASGSAAVVEAMAERVRTLFHRQALGVEGFTWIISEVTGPIVADEQDAYGRIVTVVLTLQEA